MLVRVIVLVVVAFLVTGIARCAIVGVLLVKETSEVNKLIEARDTNPFLASAEASDAPADFAVAAASAFVSGTATARTLTVAWTVNRQGPATGARHRDLLFLCPGPTFDSCAAEPVEVAIIDGATTPILARTYSRRVTIPLPAVAPGTYYLHLAVDAPDGQEGEAVQESDEGNNTRVVRVIVSGH